MFRAWIVCRLRDSDYAFFGYWIAVDLIYRLVDEEIIGHRRIILSINLVWQIPCRLASINCVCYQSGALIEWFGFVSGMPISKAFAQIEQQPKIYDVVHVKYFDEVCSLHHEIWRDMVLSSSSLTNIFCNLHVFAALKQAWKSYATLSLYVAFYA